MTVREIYEFLNEYCPYDLAMEWDNAGLNVGRMEREVTKVLLAMDVTEEAIDAAEAAGCALILTHHPLIFDAPRQVTGESYTGHRILRLAEAGIAHIACHTNLDAAEGGVNSCLAALCDLEEATLFGGIGRIGNTETTLTALIDRLKQGLPAAACLGVRCHEEVHRVAVVGGSGGGMLQEAAELGCDTFVTGEFKHDHALLARDMGLNLLMLGHYETEYIALPPLADALRARFPQGEFLLLPHHTAVESF